MSYANLNGNSGILNTLIAPDYIDVEFKGSNVYRYTENSVGSENLTIMKNLAMNGSGLNGFINKVVRYRYAKKLDEFQLIPKAPPKPPPLTAFKPTAKT